MEVETINERGLAIIKRIARIEELMVSGEALLSNQGQGLDGFSALAEFRAAAQDAKRYLEELSAPVE